MKINLLDNDNITDEYILYNYNYFKNDINKAINIVKDYIIKNQLVIVGGTAIDYALRLKNDKIYNEEYQIPDFDIISPDNVIHANNIGQILCNEKYENVSIIPAIHNTTVRVKILGFTVFDSTFIPNYLYKKIPTINYKRFLIIYPIYQKINQYLSMSFLFKNNGLNYNISDRLIKDYNRFNKIDIYYNLYNTFDNNEIINIKFEKVKINLNLHNKIEIKIFNNIENIDCDINKKINLLISDSNIYSEINSDICFHGMAAYNLFYIEFTKIYNTLEDIIKLNSEDKIFINDKYKYIIIKPNININKDYIELDIIKEIPLIMINSNNNIKNIYNNISKQNNTSKLKYLDNIIDIIPKRGIFKIDNINTEIFDLYGDYLSVNILKNNNNPIIISNYVYNLSYFLFNYYYADNEQIKKYYAYYYLSLKSMIEIINYIYDNYKVSVDKIISYENSIFSLSINTMGIKNYSNNYYYFIKNYINLVNNNTNLNVLPPKNYLTFPNCDIKNIFDKDNSLYYKDDIIEIEESNEYNNIKYLLDL